MASTSRRILILLCVTLAVANCWVVRQVGVNDFEGTGDSVAVSSPVKAHLLDGYTVVYPSGLRIARDTLRGAGTRYDLRLGNPTSVTLVPLDSVLGMETFVTQVNGAATFAYSTLTTIGVIGASIAIYCATDPKCFGSCPTFYSDSAGAAVLEAEGFSFSIAPLFEARDVDRLRAQPDSSGALRLETRNEAIETHYLNQLELLEARGTPGELMMSDNQGHVVALRDPRPAVAARDRTGRDVLAMVATADGRAYVTAPQTLAAARVGDLEDTVDLTVAAPAGADSAVLVFRMRNSLLNTVLLYDMMLGDGGARSLDWVSDTLSRIGPAVQLGQWYASHMGMNVAVRRNGGWIEAGHIRDTGPVAWKDVAIVVPASGAGPLHVRLTFIADNWRIDRVAAAFVWRRPAVLVHPLARVIAADGVADSAALRNLRDADGRYLVTQPAQYFTAVWETGPEPRDTARTFFLVSQGYYTEWIRRTWIASGRHTTPFVPSDSALGRALDRYRTVKDSLEVAFSATRVPVR